MPRIAFVMSVHPGCEQAYIDRHNPIWEDLGETLRRHGVRAYSIFLHPDTRQLFAYAEVEDPARWDAIARTEVCRKWWASMTALMPSNEDNSPVTEPLIEVFRL